MKIVDIVGLLLFYFLLNAYLNDSWSEVNESFINLASRLKADVIKMRDSIKSSGEWVRFSARIAALWEELVGTFKDLAAFVVVTFECISRIMYEFATSEQVVDFATSNIRSVVSLVAATPIDCINYAFPLYFPENIEACKILGIENCSGISAQDVGKICSRLSNETHPDHFKEEEKEKAWRKFYKIQDACNKMKSQT